jgi:uncharacterized membrane protein
MKTTRLEAFSDGVLAIIITIMVLEMKVPHETDWDALRPIVPVFLAYAMSFVYLGIYWTNHHHMLQATDAISGPVLWANLHLLFWLSLIPFVTGWMGENHLAPLPTALYGVVLFLSALSYVILQTILISKQGENSQLRQAIGRDMKGKVSLVLYLLAIVIAFWVQWLAIALYAMTALLWFIPDPRIEPIITADLHNHGADQERR